MKLEFFIFLFLKRERGCALKVSVKMSKVLLLMYSQFINNNSRYTHNVITLTGRALFFHIIMKRPLAHEATSPYFLMSLRRVFFFLFSLLRWCSFVLRLFLLLLFFFFFLLFSFVFSPDKNWLRPRFFLFLLWYTRMYVVELYVHTPGRDGVDVIMVMETSFYFSLSLAHTRYRGRGVIKAACGNETKVDDLFFSFSPLTEKRRHESTQVPSCRVNASPPWWSHVVCLWTCFQALHVRRRAAETTEQNETRNWFFHCV